MKVNRKKKAFKEVNTKDLKLLFDSLNSPSSVSSLPLF